MSGLQFKIIEHRGEVPSLLMWRIYFQQLLWVIPLNLAVGDLLPHANPRLMFFFGLGLGYLGAVVAELLLRARGYDL